MKKIKLVLTAIKKWFLRIIKSIVTWWTKPVRVVDFKHRNVMFAEDQDEYQTLPTLRIDGKEGYVISCWKFSFRDTLRILFTGKVWLSLMTFNNDLTPSNIAANPRQLYTHPDFNLKWYVKLRNYLRSKLRRIFHRKAKK